MAEETFRNYKSITSFDEVMEVVKTYISNSESIEFVTRAFNFAYEKHKEQFRKSGEPYINHCLSVTYILATYQSAPATLAAGLLHDTVEDCCVTYNDLKTLFNEDVAEIVQAVTKIKNLPDVSIEESSASTHRKLILAMAKDIRAVIVKLCDRLHNMRTLQYVKESKQIAISKETLEVYAPLAHRLGMSGLKNELENLCLYYLKPTEYNIVNSLVQERLKEHTFDINKVIEGISALLDDNDIPHRIFGRTKHLYSVYKKMYVKHTPFEKLFDLQAIRIITQTKLQCYEILGIIHTIYKPVPGRFKDYIAMPKTNMYQSLHTTVFDDNGELFEIQIRTEEMDYIAERGIAAHWIYKENATQNISKVQQLSEQQLSWLRDLIKINENSADDSDIEYMKQIQKDIFETSIYVLTPKGKIVDMPNGSTPVDFAYRVHTEVGNKCVGALVNKVIVPLDTELQSGDIVEIRTSKNSPGPSEGWLSFVKTNIAKSQIRKYLLKRESSNEENKTANYYDKGRRMFDDYCKEKLINKDDAYKQLEFTSTLNMFNVSNRYDLFVLIGQKAISSASIISRLYDHTHSIESQIGEINKRGYIVKRKQYKGNIIVSGATEGIKIETAVCCKPLPGDAIVGFITRGSGIKVHRKDCPNIINNFKENKRLIEAFWNCEIDDQIYPVDLEIISYDRHNLVVDLMGLISSMNLRIDSISARSHYETKTATLSCTVYVKNIDMLHILTAKLKSITGVIEVNRLSR